MESIQKKSWKNLLGYELCAGLGLGILYPTGIKKPAIRTKNRCETATVLVHGYMSNRSAFLPLIAYLKFHGVKNIVSFQYDFSGGIEKSAIELKKFIKEKVQSPNVNMVCHSLGGVVAQSYIQTLGGNRIVRQLTTIGSPLSGTYNAYWIPTRVGAELRPNSPLLQRLFRTKSESKNIEITAIVGDSDNIILPRESAAGEKTVKIQNTGHLGLLWSPKVMKSILISIQNEQQAAS